MKPPQRILPLLTAILLIALSGTTRAQYWYCDDNLVKNSDIGSQTYYIGQSTDIQADYSSHGNCGIYSRLYFYDDYNHVWTLYSGQTEYEFV